MKVKSMVVDIFCKLKAQVKNQSRIDAHLMDLGFAKILSEFFNNRQFKKKRERQKGGHFINIKSERGIWAIIEKLIIKKNLFLFLLTS